MRANRGAVTPTQLQFDVVFDALPDISLRDQRDALERPFVSLSKNLRKTPAEYRFGDLVVRILPNPEYGQPTIWDYDVIIYLLGQVNTRFSMSRDGKPAPPPVTVQTGPNSFVRRPGWGWENPGITVSPRALLVAIGRGTSGRDFEELRSAIGRLQTCFIETNIWHAMRLKKFQRFSLIHGFEEIAPSEHGSGGMRFVLPDWMIKSIAARKGIYQIDRGYFELSGGYERFLYRVARKIAGRRPDPRRIAMTTLHQRSGSPMALKDFAKAIRRATASPKMPDYQFEIVKTADGEVLEMVWRGNERGNETTQEYEELEVIAAVETTS